MRWETKPMIDRANAIVRKRMKNMSKEEIVEKRIAELFGQELVEKIKQLPNENETCKST